MNEKEIRSPLAKAVASDRDVSEPVATELVDRYLDWRAKLEGRPVVPWEERKAKRYIDRTWLFEGRPSVVFAGQGKGKSNFAAWTIEKTLETRPDHDIYTNVTFPWDEDGGGPPEAKPCERLHPISSLSEVLRGAATSVKAGRKPAVLIDEMDQAVTSYNWASEDAQSWQRLINIERHLRIRGPLLVYHAYRHIPIVLREGTMLKALLQVIVKEHDHWVICREEDGFLRVPPTILPYLVYGLRGFDIDVDVQDMERHLSGSVQAVAGQVLDYLDRQRKVAARREERLAEEEQAAESERINKQEVVAEIRRRLDLGGEEAKVRNIADAVGMSVGFVGKVRLAWAAERSRTSRPSRA